MIACYHFIIPISIKILPTFILTSIISLRNNFLKRTALPYRYLHKRNFLGFVDEAQCAQQTLHRNACLHTMK